MQLPNDLIFEIFKHLDVKYKLSADPGGEVPLYSPATAFALASKTNLSVFIEYFSANRQMMRSLVTNAICYDALGALNTIYNIHKIHIMHLGDTTDAYIKIANGVSIDAIKAYIKHSPQIIPLTTKYIDSIAFIMSKCTICGRTALIRQTLVECINIGNYNIAKLLIRIGIADILKWNYDNETAKYKIKELFARGFSAAMQLPHSDLGRYFISVGRYPINMGDIYSIICGCNVNKRKGFNCYANLGIQTNIYYGDEVGTFLNHFDIVSKGTLHASYKAKYLYHERWRYSTRIINELKYLCDNNLIPIQYIRRLIFSSIKYDVLIVFMGVCDNHRGDIDDFITKDIITKLIGKHRAYHMYYLMNIGYTVTPEHLNIAIRQNAALIFKLLAPKMPMPSVISIPIEYVKSQKLLDLCLSYNLIKLNRDAIMYCENNGLIYRRIIV